MDKAEFLHKLGKNIIKLRIERQMSQADLARACEKEPQSIERVENSKTNPSAYYLQQIADALNVPVAKLFDYQPKW